MNEKLTKQIKETIDTLRLDKKQADYLETSMNIAYFLGSKDGLQEGVDIMARSFNTRTDKELQK